MCGLRPAGRAVCPVSGVPERMSIVVLPQLHEHTQTKLVAHCYMRVPEGWTVWTCAGVRYTWHGHELRAKDGNGLWRFDPFRHEWRKVIEGIPHVA